MFIKPKGTYDILPQQNKLLNKVINVLTSILEKYNVSKIETPIFEHYELFHRKNEQSDMVSKETYDFFDKSQRKLTLRPEGTAGIVRSFIENKLFLEKKQHKYYYLGPFFRYERPQKNRFRQFLQFGVEFLGNDHYLVDCEILSLINDIITALKIKNTTIVLNNLGSNATRQKYIKALKEYFSNVKHKLHKETQTKILQNPLRILDSKKEEDSKIIKQAPAIKDFVSETEKKRFQLICAFLDKQRIKYKIDDFLVRGLDYYSHTVFEIKIENNNKFGAHTSLGGGGFFPSLIEELGGPHLTGIGFAFGIERLLNALEENNNDNFKNIDVFLVVSNKSFNEQSLTLALWLRKNNISCELDFLLNFKNKIKLGLKIKSKFLLFLGEKEIKNKTFTIKNTQTKEQFILTKKTLLIFLKKELA